MDTWNTSDPGLTAPDNTARTTMVVCPAMPCAGDDVTERVKPSTLPVAGRPDGAVDVVVLVEVVVVAELPELEHPVATGRATASSATATCEDRRRNIGPAYCPPQLRLCHLSRSF